jgi:NAD-dependent dihydropyrimidine dehydrogenase PreA subunit
MECGICIEQCPMDVMYKEGDTVRCDLSKCVDCGLCSSACPTKALTLHMKPEEQINRLDLPDLDALYETL